MIELTVLGSCGTFPGPNRACSGYLLTANADGSKPTHLMIDAGSGTLANLQKVVSIHELDAIWISHLHMDHCSDIALAYYLSKYAERQRDTRLPVYGPAGWHDHICRTSMSEDDMSDFFEVHELDDGARVQVGPLAVTALRTRHSVETFALRAYLNGATFAYSADTASTETVASIADSAQLFLCEASVPDHTREFPPNHLTATEAGQWARRGGATDLALTHIRPDADYESVIQNAESAFGRQVRLAREGDTFVVPEHQRPGR